MGYPHITLLNEHADFYVIAKPADIDVHCSDGSLGVIALLKLQQKTDELFPVHRLDKATSGLLLVARNHDAARSLSLSFQNREVGKYYLALSDKKPIKKQGLVKGDMLKARNGCWRLSRTVDNPTITQFFSFGNIVDGKRAFILRPYTGKTHQLRVAMKSLGAPIVGDKRYGGLAADRMYLHAFSLQFEYKGRAFCYTLDPDHGEFFCSHLWQQWLTQLADLDSLPWPTINLGKRKELGQA